MNSNVIVGILAISSLIGVIALAVLKIDTQVLVPILTVLVGYLVGNNKNAIIGAIKK